MADDDPKVSARGLFIGAVVVTLLILAGLGVINPNPSTWFGSDGTPAPRSAPGVTQDDNSPRTTPSRPRPSRATSTPARPPATTPASAPATRPRATTPPAPKPVVIPAPRAPAAISDEGVTGCQNQNPEAHVVDDANPYPASVGTTPKRTFTSSGTRCLLVEVDWRFAGPASGAVTLSANGPCYEPGSSVKTGGIRGTSGFAVLSLHVTAECGPNTKTTWTLSFSGLPKQGKLLVSEADMKKD
jgi:hypothetical protein